MIVNEQDTPMTDFIAGNIAEMPGYSGRGVKLVTDCFTKELMIELISLPKMAQFEFWTGVYLAVCANIKGATAPCVLKMIQDTYIEAEKCGPGS